MFKDAVRTLGRLVPPIRQLHDAALREHSGRMAAEAEIRRLRAMMDTPPVETQIAVPDQVSEQCKHWAYLKARRQLIEVDFPVNPRVRFGYEAPSEPIVSKLLGAARSRYEANLRGLLPLIEPMLTIPPHPVADPAEPNWQNLAFPALDAMALYGLIALRRPRRFLEIGSGFSTKFARRSIKDHGLATTITSIDPEPRAEVDAICDEVIRKPLEDVDMGFFEDLDPDVLVFFDGSHRTFQNSDVTVFFTEILPRLRPGTMFGIHDIFLPDDYPVAWLDWYFSEQYMLTCWLLAGDKLRIEFPAHFIGRTPELHSLLSPMWHAPNLQGANHFGGAFFATINPSTTLADS
jgi:hypothetical protein